MAVKNKRNYSMQNDNGPYNLALDKHQYLILNNQNDDPNGIDFFKLIVDLYKKRWFIISITTLCTLLTIGITLTLTPQYQTKTLLSKPNEDQFQALYRNTDRSLSAAELFLRFVKTLSSKSNYISFLQESGLLDATLKKAKAVSGYQKQILLNKLALDYSVLITSHYKNDPKDSYKDNSLEVELLTRADQLDLNAQQNKSYIEYTNAKVLSHIAAGERSITQRKISNLKRSIELDLSKIATQRNNEVKRLVDQQSLTIAELNNKIDALKKRDLRDKQLRLLELNNALKIAESLGITSYDAPQQVNNHGVVIDVNQNRTDLYLRGTTYLKKEIALTKIQKHSLSFEKSLSALQEQLFIAQNNKKILALKNRTDDKPYIKGIEKKLTTLKHMESLSFDLSKINCFKIEGSHIIEKSPFKPSKKIIVILGFIFGLMISSLFVIMQNGFRARKKLEL